MNTPTPDFTVHAINCQTWMTDKEYTWAQLEEISRVNTAKRFYGDGNKVLVAIKSQDPLKENGDPGPEFLMRLRFALILIDQHIAEGNDVTVMTFGMPHKGCEHTSLAESGAKWLEDHGVPPECIISNPSIGGGNEEDDAAALEFASNPNYKSMYVVMSSGQYDRSRFFFISVGWQPFLLPIPFLDAPPRHSSICEFSGKFKSSAYSMVNNGVDKIYESSQAAHQRHEEEFAAFRAQQTSVQTEPNDPAPQDAPAPEAAAPAGANADTNTDVPADDG